MGIYFCYAQRKRVTNERSASTVESLMLKIENINNLGIANEMKSSDTVEAEKSPPTNDKSSLSSIKNDNCTSVSKKRKTVTKASSTTSNDSKTDDGYTQLSLSDLKKSMEGLHRRVPAEKMCDNTSSSVREWAEQMQAVLEEFNLLIACVSSSTYKWGTDRTGAADQNLSLLFSEINSAQDQISSSVTTRISNVLAPVVDICVSKTTKKHTQNGEQITINEFSHNLVDPNYVRMCELSLHRNARMLRQVVFANFYKIEKVMGDYINATNKDAQTNHNAFSY